jgi:beta-glucosidase
MPWIDKVSTVLWAPYAGNETGSALGNILFGHQAPSGRLSITFPRREEDVPAFLDFRSEMGKVNYNEGIFVGYKHYAARKIDPLFAFGHVRVFGQTCLH